MLDPTYTGPIVEGPPVIQRVLSCDALVKVSKGVWRRCRRKPEFSGSIATHRGYSQLLCWVHVERADTIRFAVEAFE